MTNRRIPLLPNCPRRASRLAWRRVNGEERGRWNYSPGTASASAALKPFRSRCLCNCQEIGNDGKYRLSSPVPQPEHSGGTPTTFAGGVLLFADDGDFTRPLPPGAAIVDTAKAHRGLSFVSFHRPRQFRRGFLCGEWKRRVQRGQDLHLGERQQRVFRS